MKKLLLSLIVFGSCFGMKLDENTDSYQYRQWGQNFIMESVGVIKNRENVFIGTLIHPRVVLTSACALQNNGSYVFQITNGNQKYTIKGRPILRSKFKDDKNPPFKNIGLLILEDPILDIQCATLPNTLAEVPLVGVSSGFITADPDSSFVRLGYMTASPIYFEDCYISPAYNQFKIKYFGCPGRQDYGAPVLNLIDSKSVLHAIVSYHLSFSITEIEENKKSKEALLDGTLYLAVYPHINWIEEMIHEHVK
jgi:hypothetical protein